MVQVLVGFLGGLAAVALKSYVDVAFERQRERKSIRVAARLVAHELSNACLWLDMVIDSRRWEVPEAFVFNHDVWRSHKETLAHLSWEEWVTIESGYRTLKMVEADYARDVAKHDRNQLVPPTEFNDSDISLLTSQLRDIDTARSTLEALARGRGVGR